MAKKWVRTKKRFRCKIGIHKMRIAWIKIEKATGKEVGMYYDGYPINDTKHEYYIGHCCDCCNKFKYFFKDEMKVSL